MESEQEKKGPGQPIDKVGDFYSFLAEEVFELDGSALDDFIANNGGDFKALDKRMAGKTDVAFGKARMASAKASRTQFVAEKKRVISAIGLTIEQKLEEIKTRLGSLGPKATLVYSRNYEGLEDEAEIDDLLLELRQLDDRAGDL